MFYIFPHCCRDNVKSPTTNDEVDDKSQETTDNMSDLVYSSPLKDDIGENTAQTKEENDLTSPTMLKTLRMPAFVSFGGGASPPTEEPTHPKETVSAGSSKLETEEDLTDSAELRSCSALDTCESLDSLPMKLEEAEVKLDETPQLPGQNVGLLAESENLLTVDNVDVTDSPFQDDDDDACSKTIGIEGSNLEENQQTIETLETSEEREIVLDDHDLLGAESVDSDPNVKYDLSDGKDSQVIEINDVQTANEDELEDVEPSVNDYVDPEVDASCNLTDEKDLQAAEGKLDIEMEKEIHDFEVPDTEYADFEQNVSHDLTDKENQGSETNLVVSGEKCSDDSEPLNDLYLKPETTDLSVADLELIESHDQSDGENQESEANLDVSGEKHSDDFEPPIDHNFEPEATRTPDMSDVADKEGDSVEITYLTVEKCLKQAFMDDFDVEKESTSLTDHKEVRAGNNTIQEWSDKGAANTYEEEMDSRKSTEVLVETVDNDEYLDAGDASPTENEEKDLPDSDKIIRDVHSCLPSGSAESGNILDNDLAEDEMDFKRIKITPKQPPKTDQSCAETLTGYDVIQSAINILPSDEVCSNTDQEPSDTESNQGVPQSVSDSEAVCDQSDLFYDPCASNAQDSEKDSHQESCNIPTQLESCASSSSTKNDEKSGNLN